MTTGSGRRLRRIALLVPALLLGFATVSGMLFGTVQSAAAAEADCEGTMLATSGRELFTPRAEVIPPPLRGFDWDCVSRLSGEGDAVSGDSRQYLYAFLDAKVSTVVELLRSFERAGWIEGPVLGGMDPGSGSSFIDGVELSADGLAAMETEPDYIRARFGDASTGRDIIELTYTDGDAYKNDTLILTPSIYLVVMGDRLYSAAGFSDPSVLSALRTIDQALPSPTQLAVVCSVSVILMLIVGYPAVLLNSVIGGRYQKVVAWMRSTLRGRRGGAGPAGREAAPPDATDATDAAPASRRRGRTSWLVWPGFVLAAIVAGFVDPQFGPNLLSLRVLLTGFLSFVVFNLAGWAVVRRVIRRLEPDAGPHVTFRWGSLLILLVAVLVARLLDFSPGVIFGLVSGLAFAITLTASRKAVVVLVGSGFALLASLLGWIGYSLLAPLAADGNAVLVFATEFLSGVTLEGIATLPIALLPLAALDGAELMRWKKWVWAVGYAIGLAAFALVLFTIPDSFSTYTGDFLRWSLLFVAFAVVAVVIWWIDAAATRRAAKRRGDVAPA